MAKNDICSAVESMLKEFLEGRDLEIYNIQFKKEGPDWKLKLFLDKTEGAE